MGVGVRDGGGGGGVLIMGCGLLWVVWVCFIKISGQKVICRRVKRRLKKRDVN